MNPLRKKIKNLKIWAAKELFKIYFRSFYFPFTDSNETYLKMSKEDRIVYLSSVHQWVNSQACKIESEGIIGKFYTDLALKANDDVMITAYRIALMIEQDKQKRLIELDKIYNALIK